MQLKIAPILVYALVGFILLNLKSIALPVGWFEVFFHELSHGMAAILTGGSVVNLEMNFNGSGSLTHRGSGFRMFVSFAGYSGAALWGLLIYKIFSPVDKTTKSWTLGLIVLIAGTTLLWVRDLETLAVSLCLLAILAFSWQLLSDRAASHLMGIVGASLIVSSTQSAWMLTNLGSNKGDATSLAKASLVLPTYFWIILWIVFSLGCLLWIFKREQSRGAQFKL